MATPYSHSNAVMSITDSHHYAVAQKCGLDILRRMGHDPEALRASLRRIMAERDVTAHGWAVKAGVAPSTPRNFLKGRSNSLDYPILKKMASVFGMTVEDLESSRPKRYIPVVGHVGAGGHIFPIDDLPLVADDFGLQGHQGEQPMGIEMVEAPPEAGSRRMVAVRVKGDSMVPAMQDGWLLYYSNRQEADFDDLINQLCVVKMPSGATMVKVIQRYGHPGRYNLFSYNAALMESIEIEWAAKVLFIKPA